MRYKKNKGRIPTGFTLVELSIVLLIIGLIVGGIIKGIELVENARIAEFSSQVKEFSSKATSFSFSYNYYPGDYNAAQSNLPGCDPATCLNGDGNGFVAPLGSRFYTKGFGFNLPPMEHEGNFFFIHMKLAGLIDEVQDELDTSENAGFGHGLPSTSMGGGLRIDYVRGGNFADPTDPSSTGDRGFFTGPPSTNIPPGNYFIFTSHPYYNIDNPQTMIVTPTRAHKIDYKIDDGNPGRGSVAGIQASNATATNGCIIVSDGTLAYNVDNRLVSCSLVIRAF